MQIKFLTASLNCLQIHKLLAYRKSAIFLCEIYLIVKIKQTVVLLSFLISYKTL